jgi:hypothetical protein
MTTATEVQTCAEYLCLLIARRNGWGPRQAGELAHLTGLPVMACANLVRSPDLHDILRRRQALNRSTAA